jgi:competence protein ComEA
MLEPLAPVPPLTPTEKPPDQATPRSVQFASAGILIVLIGLLGWRWYDDHRGMQPTEQFQETTLRIDLNRASRAELLQLPGVGPQTADHILAYRDSKGRFKKVEDLKGVKGIGDATLKKLRPWLIVEELDSDLLETPAEPERLTRKPIPPQPLISTSKKPAPTGIINLNTATSEELQTLPNIGPAYAQRILTERAKRPFTSIDDLRRVSGIGPKRLEAIRPLVTVEDE